MNLVENITVLGNDKLVLELSNKVLKNVNIPEMVKGLRDDVEVLFDKSRGIVEVNGVEFNVLDLLGTLN